MNEITRAPMRASWVVDLAKQVIQVHGVDGSGRRVVARAFKRDQFLAWCAQLPRGLRGGDGGVLAARTTGRAGCARWGWMRG